ncbi:GT99 family glycosyltransferase N-terminal domain-containing protein [Serratia rubidaea]|uniref:N-glycosyltransferase n=1 Tax=Serratia rubidaea TaxID=61652 RepID=A0A448SXR9_SERRU|nr:glycosyltransferase [Serratia rubidaea]MEB7584259.1 glycosyltransferase [Serratia rubidaea]VEI72514.1 N-glycosyltransferase [Serratia rubidaea]
MISIFLPSFPFRGVKAPYLWFFYRVLSSIKEPVHFILGEDYLSSCEAWQADERWEMTDDAQKRLGYSLPDFRQMNDHKFSVIDESFLNERLKQCHHNPDLLFKTFITEEIPALVQEIDSALGLVDNTECVLTWCNCPSLNKAASERNIRVVNLELGPLRPLEYLATAYFDFSGVNGNTEAEQRYLTAKNAGIAFGDARNVAQMRSFFASEPVPEFEAPEYDVGIVLQVENDSNILAFSNTFNNQSLLDYADYHNLGRKLIRSHPGSRFALNKCMDTIDHSPSSIEFITRCKHILTINSSVGLEAMLMDVPVTVLGDCSYAFCNVEDEAERNERLAFYLFSYLVPFNLLFDIDYIRFRLSTPSETEIIKEHVNYYIEHGDFMRNFGKDTKASSIIDGGISERNLEKEAELMKETVQKLSTDLTSKENYIFELEEKLSMLEKTLEARSEYIVDVIVPVYAGLQETQECIESALETLPHWADLVVINDASPEPELTQWLRERSKTGGFTLLENQENLGFVATVNRGMKLNPKRDVLLLNSDVEVANDWLERIREAAYSRPRVGSITPFSNNATICSFPRFCEDNELFLGMNVQQLDDQFETYGRENNLIEIPTGVGFCMYIRRDCLNEVGYFDVETFGRGYGEENDWCQRAAKAGWPNFHQLNVFVYHKGGVSFAGEQSPRKTRALELLNELHPNYTKDVMDFIAQDPAKKARQQLLLRILAKKNLSKVLLVTHKMSGGVTQHIKELADFYNQQAHFLVLKPEVDGQSVALLLDVSGSECREKFVIDISHGYETLVNLLRFIGVGHIHYHHLIGVPSQVLELSNSLGCQYDITIHDYYFINANPTLTKKNGMFAGEEADTRDRLCNEHYPKPEGMSAIQWRNIYLAWLEGAERVIFPSADTQVRFITAFPTVAKNSIIAWHPDYENHAPYPDVKSDYQAGNTLKVLVLGAISREKGALLLDEVANELKHDNIEFHLLGYAFRPLNGGVKCHGAYSSSDLADKLAEIQPDIVWFPARWPETYSYTLSIALEQGLPVVVPNLGAFVERVSGRGFSRVVAWDSSVQQMCTLWRSLLNDPAAFFSVENVSSTLDISMTQRTADFYRHGYLQDNWLRENELGTVDYKELSESFCSSESIEIIPVIEVAPQGRKEKLLAILWKLTRHPALAWAVKLIPYRVQRYVKRCLSRRAIHEVVR